MSGLIFKYKPSNINNGIQSQKENYCFTDAGQNQLLTTIAVECLKYTKYFRSRTIKEKLAVVRISIYSLFIAVTVK